MTSILQQSPIDAKHRELGARLVPFAGWEMPVMYTSIIEEHQAVREKVGVFDISHMGQVFVSGAGAEKWLNLMLTNNVASLSDGEAHYTFLLNQDGGVIDDLILYRLEKENYLLVVNASKIAEDIAWLEEHCPKKVSLKNESESWAGMAVQGPDSPEIYASITGGRTLPGRNHVDDITHEGQRIIVCRTGYTGEDGFELFCVAEQGGDWFGKFVEAGATPCGLGARDSLRLEMCYPLNGNDLTPETSPIEAGLGFFVDLEKDEFMGRDLLSVQKEIGPSKRLMALKMTEKGAPPRPGYPVFLEGGGQIGELCSGGLSPSLGMGIGLVYIPRDTVEIDTKVEIEVRGRRFPAVICKKPFLTKK